MFTVEILHSEGTTIHETTTINIVDDNQSAEALKDYVKQLAVDSISLPKGTDYMRSSHRDLMSARLETPSPHADLKAVVITDDGTYYLYLGGRCYIKNSVGESIYSLEFKFKSETKADSELESVDDEVLTKLAHEGGCLVSRFDCSEDEITAAKSRKDFYTNFSGHEFVRLLPGQVIENSRYYRAIADSSLS